jgi:predicted CoA-binding protein
VSDETRNAGEAPEEARARRVAERARAIAWLDLDEGRSDVAVLDAGGIVEVLRKTRRIAMIGASSNPMRPSNGVFRYLRRVGYDVVPVNPAERDVDGVAAYPTLAAAVAATGPFELVDVFRRPEFCVEHAREAVAAGAMCLWLQLGIINAEAGRIAAEGGLSVVMDRCTKVEHARLIG